MCCWQKGWTEYIPCICICFMWLIWLSELIWVCLTFWSRGSCLKNSTFSGHLHQAFWHVKMQVLHCAVCSICFSPAFEVASSRYQGEMGELGSGLSHTSQQQSQAEHHDLQTHPLTKHPSLSMAWSIPGFMTSAHQKGDCTFLKNNKW